MEFEQPKKRNPPLEEEGPIFNCIYSHTYIHTYSHTCIYTCIHTCSHKHIRKYIRQNIVLALWHLFLFFFSFKELIKLIFFFIISYIFSSIIKFFINESQLLTMSLFVVQGEKDIEKRSFLK